MRKLRKLAVVGAMAAVATVPLALSGGAGAQDAGDCGSGGVAASSESTNAGGLLGALIPINLQVVLPLNAPIASPNAQNCNSNEVEVGVVEEVVAEKAPEHVTPAPQHVAPAPTPSPHVAPVVVAVPRFAG
jgi:hypothetical protein